MVTASREAPPHKYISVDRLGMLLSYPGQHHVMLFVHRLQAVGWGYLTQKNDIHIANGAPTSKMEANLLRAQLKAAERLKKMDDGIRLLR